MHTSWLIPCQRFARRWNPKELWLIRGLVEARRAEKKNMGRSARNSRWGRRAVPDGAKRVANEPRRANTFPSKLWLHRRPIFVSRAALTSRQRQITTRVFIYSSFFPSLILFPVFQFQFLLLFCYSACHSAFSFPFNSSPVTFLLSMGPRVFRLVSLGIRARRFSEVNTWYLGDAVVWRNAAGVRTTCIPTF